MISIEVFCVIVFMFAVAVVAMVFVVYDFSRKVKEVERYAKDISTMTTSAHDRCREVLDHCGKVIECDMDMNQHNVKLIMQLDEINSSVKSKLDDISDETIAIAKGMASINGFADSMGRDQGNNHKVLFEIKHMVSDIKDDVADLKHDITTLNPVVSFGNFGQSIDCVARACTNVYPDDDDGESKPYIGMKEGNAYEDN